MDDPSPTGALFFAASDALTANVILKKLREDGKHNRTSAKKPSGFGDDGLVGLAIHPPKNGWWAVRDSADGAPGIAGRGLDPDVIEGTVVQQPGVGDAVQGDPAPQAQVRGAGALVRVPRHPQEDLLGEVLDRSGEVRVAVVERFALGDGDPELSLSKHRINPVRGAAHHARHLGYPSLDLRRGHRRDTGAG